VHIRDFRDYVADPTSQIEFRIGEWLVVGEFYFPPDGRPTRNNPETRTKLSSKSVEHGVKSRPGFETLAPLRDEQPSVYAIGAHRARI